MSDPHLAALNNFTTTRHGPTIPANLYLPSTPLPKGFSLLILGASEGVGEHIAYAYARAGASKVIISARRLPNLERVKSELHNLNASIRVEVFSCDVASATSVAALSLFVKEKSGRLDCVIVNAAYAPPITLKAHLDQPEDIQRAFDVNCQGSFNAAHYFIPLLLSSPHGARQFFAIGSMAGSIRRGHIANMGYCVSKMALTRMIEYLHEQYSSDSAGGLFAVTIHPGAVNTEMAKGNTPESFIPYLVDDVGLCGAFCVSLTKRVSDGGLRWLGGRFVSATWDIDELLAKETKIAEGDLLKFALILE